MAITIVANTGNLTPTQREVYLEGFYGSDVEDLSFIRQTQSLRPLSVTGLNAAPDYVSHTEGQTISTNAVEKGYTETFDYEAWELGVALSSRVMREMDPTLMGEYMLSFAGAGARRFHKSCFAVLNNCTSASYLKGDGVALVSASHPSNVGNQSNSGSSALDNTAFEAGVKALREMLGPDGQVIPHEAGQLYVPPALEGTAYQVLGSEYSAADDRRAINISRVRGVGYSSSAYLSAANGGSDTRWFLLSRKAMQRGLLRIHVFDAPAPRIERIEGSKADQRIIDACEWETGSLGWRGLYSSSS